MSDLRDGTQWETYFESPTREPFDPEETDSAFFNNDDDNDQQPA